MNKECWQLENLLEPTPCFKQAGNTPCDTPGCSVIDRIKELREKGVKIDAWWLNILPHSACRLSSVCPNNQEFLQRTSQSNTEISGKFK